MLRTYLYWICSAALILCVFLSLTRRQMIRELAEARKKLLEEREQREALRAELVHARNAADKDATAAKKLAAETKSSLDEVKAEKTKLIEERDAFQVELDGVRASLAERTASVESAEKRVAELEAQARTNSTSQDKLDTAERDLQAARAKTEALEKKIDGEARSRKAAEDERNAVKVTVTTLENKLREAERAKTQLADAHAKEVKSLRDASSTFESELAATKERLTKAEAELAEERSKVQTPAAVPSGGDVLAALDADTLLNRGQKETIRMTYNQFTAKRRSS